MTTSWPAVRQAASPSRTSAEPMPRCCHAGRTDIGASAMIVDGCGSHASFTGVKRMCPMIASAWKCEYIRPDGGPTLKENGDGQDAGRHGADAARRGSPAARGDEDRHAT